MSTIILVPVKMIFSHALAIVANLMVQSLYHPYRHFQPGYRMRQTFAQI